MRKKAMATLSRSLPAFFAPAAFQGFNSRSFAMRALRRQAPQAQLLETFYADAGIDRATEHRSDPAWISKSFHDPRALVVPVSKSRNIVKSDQAVLVATKELQTLQSDVNSFVFLGLTTGERLPVFALDIKDHASADSHWQKNGEWVDLRKYGPSLQASDAGLLAYARGIIQWNSQNKFCGLCGTQMTSSHAGHNLKCSSCQNSIYPRLDPAVIMLITSGDYILLGRQQKWEQGRYSLLAGFVEIGETFEQAVVREVKEEAGVDVELSTIKYVASQPWPFPSSLMVGFTGEVKTASEDEDLESLPQVCTNSSELEDAKWFHKNFLKAVLHGEPIHANKFNVPGKYAIARLLMEQWVNDEDDKNEAWPGDNVPTTKIDEGKFKYVLLRVKDEGGNQKLVVRGNSKLEFHLNILEALAKEVAPLGLKVEPLGGGKLEHFPEKGVIHVFGASQAYGPANHLVTARLLSQSFPLYDISVSMES